METLENKAVQFFEAANLETRPGQIELTKEISRAIALKRTLAAEAGVGLGKSFAYLVPALLQYENDHRQIIIATSTIALQEQLYKDAQQIAEMLGIHPEIILAKGMKNYVCLKKLRSRIRKHPEEAYLHQINRLVKEEHLQDRAEMPLHFSDEEWETICISKFGNVHCDHCLNTNACAYARLRSWLVRQNGIVICNHNMLLSHLLRKRDCLPIFNRNVSTMIIDEAHHLDPLFREAFTQSYGKEEMLHLVKSCANGTLQSRSLITSTVHDIVALFRLFRDEINAQQSDTDGDTSAYYFNCTPHIRELLGKIKHRLPKIEEDDELSELYHFLRKAYHNAEDSIIWLEDHGGIRLCICKKDIRSDIRSMLYQIGRATILTSATLTGQTTGTPQQQYSYFLDSVGYPGVGAIATPKPSPFDYDRYTMLYCSTNLPVPRQDEREIYRLSALREIIKLLQITNGKTLILFTAKSDMQFIYKKLSNMQLPYKILMQSTGSQEKLLEQFRSDTDSVLLGSGVCWEGINVPGESLSQVIVYRLPFPVPDPIIDYKVSQTSDPMHNVLLPEMLIKLRQGVGRLIRTEKDCGIISILDPRACSSSYSAQILQALSMQNRTSDLDELARFWNTLKEED